MLEKRRKLKRFGRKKIESNEISKLIRRKWNEWTNNRKTQELETIKLEKSVKAFKRFKKLGINTLIRMKDKEGNKVREIEGILAIICEFYAKLYNKD